MYGYTIMIIDDESQMRELVRTFLEAENNTMSLKLTGRGSCLGSNNKDFTRLINR